MLFLFLFTSSLIVFKATGNQHPQCSGKTSHESQATCCLLIWELYVHICPQFTSCKLWEAELSLPLSPACRIEAMNPQSSYFWPRGGRQVLHHCWRSRMTPSLWLLAIYTVVFCAVAESFLPLNWMFRYRIAVSQNGFEAEFIICEYPQLCLDYLWRSEHVKPFTLRPVYQTEEFCFCFSFFFLKKNLGLKHVLQKKKLYFCQWIGNGHSLL